MRSQFTHSFSSFFTPAVAALAAVAASAFAADDSSDVATESVAMSPFVITGETLRDDMVQTPFLPETHGTAVFAGKKTLVVDFDAMPQIQTDNYRQAFSKTPGLLTSELSNHSLLSLNYRGIGDPHESQNILVLKDGVPFSVDPFGYPTVYYAPPFESVDRLEFVAGGSALLYGPQPSGALNYVTHAPQRDRLFALSTQHIIGSDDLYSTYTTAEGGIGPVGYQMSFDRRTGDSFRDANSDFKLQGANFKFTVDLPESSRLLVSFDAYDADSGEPGGLTLATTAGSLNYNTSRTQTQNPFDRVRIKRSAGLVRYDRDFGSDATLSATAWVSQYSRYSKRQNGSGFGRALTGTTNTVNLHEYYTAAADVRFRRDFQSGSGRRTLTAGVTAMSIESPITNRTGSTPNADTGVRTFRAERESRYAAAFGEYVYRTGNLTLTPGVRVEFLRQNIEEQQNNSKTAAGKPLATQADDELVPLFGLGATYKATVGELYANVSTSYKPKTYSDAVPTGANDTVSTTLEPGNAINYELGWRGRSARGVWYDVSGFIVDYDNRFGRVGSNLQNVGRSLNIGLSAATEINLSSLTGFLAPDNADAFSGLSWHINAQWLDASFVSGPLDGRTPQYAPETMLRTGLVYRVPHRLKLAVLATYLDDHFADDANTRTATADWLIPSYSVVDVTAEFYPWRADVAGRDTAVAILAGVNNLFDEEYWSRVRSNGIDPARGRNTYIGVRVEF